MKPCPRERKHEVVYDSEIEQLMEDSSSSLNPASDHEFRGLDSVEDASDTPTEDLLAPELLFPSVLDAEDSEDS